MLKTRRSGSVLSAQTVCASLEWDASRGGQIAAFAVEQDGTSRQLLPEGHLWPGLRFRLAGGRELSLADARASIEMEREMPGRVAFRASSVLGDGLMRVELHYEVFEEGAVFCELVLQLEPGKAVELVGASLELPVEVSAARNARWGHYSRHPWSKPDPTCIHVLSTHRLYLPLEETADGRELFPLASLDLGWEGVRFFSNHLEFLLEDWTTLGDASRDRTRTEAGMEGGHWRLRWHLYEGPPLRLADSYRYRNRWGVLFGCPRTQAGPEVDPARRNNIIGARIAHCMYPYVRQSPEWPWVVMPIKQTIYQDAQNFVGFPELERVDEVADAGANVMIIHQFWMSNPGSNGEPPADYQPADPAWLKAFVDRCHQRGMRVAPYIRGTEMYSFYSSFFEDFFRRDWDGLYMDWTCPLAHGFIKGSSLHFSAYNYFMFMRALRRRVGEGGFIIGHTGNHTFLNAAHLDVCLAGEFSVMHEVLLADPQASAYHALLAGCGAHLLGGDTADRKIFASPRAMAYCAALGMTSHPFLSPRKPFSETASYMFPLWDALRHLSGPPVRLYNPAVSRVDALRCEQPDVFPVAYQAADGRVLLTVTNLGEPTDVAVEVDVAELGLPASARLMPIEVAGAPVGQTASHVFRVRGLPTEGFCAALIG